MKVRLVSVLASATLAAAALSVSATAQAVPVPVEEQFYVHTQGLMQNRSTNTVDAAFVGFTAPNGVIPAGSYADVTFSSCGQVIQSRRHDLSDPDGDAKTAFMHNFSADGTPTTTDNEIKRLIGRTVDWSATVVQPGSDPYVLAFSLTTSVPRPSCEEVLNGSIDDNPEQPTAIKVTKWSVKKGATTAKVGKTLKVTPTRAPGSKVTYTWKVGTKTVDRDRAMAVKKAYVGKKVTMRVTVSKTGAKSVSKTLRYGLAR